VRIDWNQGAVGPGMRKGATRASVAAERSSVTRVATTADAEFDGRVHRHDHEQWLVMLAGALELTDDGERYWVKPGDVVLFPRHTWHAAVAVGPEGAEYFEIFAPARYDQLLGYVALSPLEWS
jgi:quercetin dioxygenase-like cupin family protein